MPDTYSAEEFRSQVLASFPELEAECEEDPGLLHIHVGSLARVLTEAKDRGDWDTHARGIRIVDRLWERPDPSLLNALSVSFLEYLEFDGSQGQRAWELLTPPLQEGWTAMQQYLKDLAAARAPAPRPFRELIQRKLRYDGLYPRPRSRRASRTTPAGRSIALARA